jgi:hypothetical protein
VRRWIYSLTVTNGLITANPQLAEIASSDLPASGVMPGTYTSVTVNSAGVVTAGTNPATVLAIGETITGSNADGSVLWQSKTGKLEQDLAGNFFYDPDGTYGPLLTASTLYVGGADGNASAGYYAMWDTELHFWSSLSSVGAILLFNSVPVPIPFIYTTLGLTDAAVLGYVTSPNDSGQHVYSISAFASITAIATDVLEINVSYTDENGTPQTLTLIPLGASTPQMSTTGVYTFATFLIYTTFNTLISVNAILTTSSGSIAYDGIASITLVL